MSGFDSNPFAEPEAANPFSDPSVTQYAPTRAVSAGLDEYNPFADGDLGAATTPASTQPAVTVPAVVPPVQQPMPAPVLPAPTLPTVPAPSQPPPAYQTQDNMVFPGEHEEHRPHTMHSAIIPPNDSTMASGMGASEPILGDTGNLSAAQQLELARREPNFPPLPKCCPVKPCFYHNIQLEIPSRDAKLVRTLFIYWEAVVFTYFYNMVALLTLFADTGDFGTDFGFSVLWLMLYSPCSFVCWYHCAYRAFKADSSLRFMIFFVTFFCQCAYNVVQAVGFVGSGGCGLIVALKAKKDAHSVVFFMAIASFVLWTLMSLAGSFLLVKIHRYYRSSGHSIQRVQTEAGTALAQNEGVRSAVISGVKASF